MFIGYLTISKRKQEKTFFQSLDTMLNLRLQRHHLPFGQINGLLLRMEPDQSLQDLNADS